MLTNLGCPHEGTGSELLEPVDIYANLCKSMQMRRVRRNREPSQSRAFLAALRSGGAKINSVIDDEIVIQ